MCEVYYADVHSTDVRVHGTDVDVHSADLHSADVCGQSFHKSTDTSRVLMHSQQKLSHTIINTITEQEIECECTMHTRQFYLPFM